jgi:diguanylate cyclase (GGDEF)-like protein/PAS domain S-box-containing protein
MLATNDLHQLFYVKAEMGTKVDYHFLKVEFGPFWWLHTTYSYLALFTGLCLFIRMFLLGSNAVRLHLGYFLVASVLPYASNILYIMGIRPYGFLDLTPVAFMLTGVILSIGVMTDKLFYIKPLAAELLLESIPDAIIVADTDARILSANPAALALPLANSTQPDLKHRPNHALLDLEQLLPTKLRLGKGDMVIGDRTYFCTQTEIKGLEEDCLGHVIMLRDITERKQIAEALRIERDLAQNYLNLAGVIFVVLDSNGIVELINLKGCEILRLKQLDIIGKNWFEHFVPQRLRSDVEQVFKKLMEGDLSETELYENSVISANNGERIIGWRNTVLRDKEGNITGTLSAGEDLTDRKLAEQQIIYMSFHDQLTGLYNRHFLEREMTRLDVERQLPISLIMIDVNGLKMINDSYGHSYGDELLQKAADVIKGSCRKEDIIARWGGDEFLILLPQTTISHAERICQRISTKCRNCYVGDVPISMALGIADKTSKQQSLLDVLCEAEDKMYKQKLSESRSIRNTVLQALLKTLAEKGFETQAHSERIRDIAIKMGEKLNLPQSEISRLNLLATLHDIGKITIPPEILHKQGTLTPEEWEIIKKHPETGYRIARTMEDFAHVANEILAHHERWNGTGYPQGLKGEDIPLLARIISIADTYEVMTSDRPYKQARNHNEIIAEIQQCAGTHFDPELVQIFLEII